MVEISIWDRAIMQAPVVIICVLSFTGLLLLGLGKLLEGAIILVIALIFFLLCLRQIPYRPPYIGLVVIWGRRLPIIKEEGWRLLAPFFPFLYSVTLVNVEKKNTDFVPRDVRTQEEAELRVEISITWTPDRKDPTAIIEYINTGGREGVEDILEDIIEEKIREWAIRKSWRECLRANVEAAEMLIREITGVEEPIEIKRIRRGNGLAKVRTLGIVINRLNIGTIKVLGKLAEEAELTAREQRQREAEKIELRHVAERIKELVEQTGISPETAADLVQTERRKVTKNIKKIDLRGLQELGEAIARVIIGKK